MAINFRSKKDTGPRTNEKITASEVRVISSTGKQLGVISIREALNQAMDARHHILDIMEETISDPAEKLSGNAPRLETVELPKDKIGEVIGPKGKNIRKIEEETGVSVEIDDDGILTLGSTEEEGLEAAKEMVMLIINPPEVSILGVGKSYDKITNEDGQFVTRKILPISLSYDHRIIDGAEAARFSVHLSQSLGKDFAFTLAV